MTDRQSPQPSAELTGRKSAIPLPANILEAFNIQTSNPDVSSTTEILPGGEGTSYLHRPTDTVFKPAWVPIEAKLIANILSQIPQSNPSFQSPQPLRSNLGTFVHDSWSASTYIHDVRPLIKHQKEYTLERFRQIIVASDAYHTCLRDVSISDADTAHLRSGAYHVWARSHQTVWGSESDARVILEPFAPELVTEQNHPWIHLVERIVKLREQLDDAPAENEKLFREESQIIHGDLIGGDNVLFPKSSLPSDTTPSAQDINGPVRPLIIDLSPTFAPSAYATGIMVADGLIWCQIGPELIELVGRTSRNLDMVRRGLLFRCLSDMGLVARGRDSALPDVIEIERVTGVLERLVQEHKNDQGRQQR